MPQVPKAALVWNKRGWFFRVHLYGLQTVFRVGPFVTAREAWVMAHV